ncbi:MAG: enolase C-terminal domain-like protein [Isosphaeraceae bacterium]
MLDENVDSIDLLLRAHADRAMDVVNIKISKFGGLTRARQARDLCVTLGLGMTIEDSWGGDVIDGPRRPPGPQHAPELAVHPRPTSTAT